MPSIGETLLSLLPPGEREEIRRKAERARERKLRAVMKGGRLVDPDGLEVRIDEPDSEESIIAEMVLSRRK